MAGTACGAGESAFAEPLTFAHAYAQRTCSPWDGPATALYLADGEAASGVVPRPLLMISVYESAIRVSGRRYRLTPEDDQVGVALACPTEDTCEAIPETVVEFGQIDERARAQVTVRVTQGDGRVADGRFTATWLQPADLCG